jgi:GntR family phosphonate transport system transcriptional regulator
MESEEAQHAVEAPRFHGKIGPGTIARGEGVAAWRQIADEIAGGIASGIWAQGTQLPTEAQLASRFSVNRHTVRRALSALAAEGLVRATQGRGTFVENKPLSYPIGARTRFSEIVSKAGHEAGGELLSAIEVRVSETIAAELGIVPGDMVLKIISRRFVDGTPVSFAQSHLPLPRFAGFADLFARTGSITQAFKHLGVEDYKRLETRISARPAEADEALHLDLMPGRTLLVVDSINVDMAGVPIQTTRALFAADRVELKVC